MFHSLYFRHSILCLTVVLSEHHSHDTNHIISKTLPSKLKNWFFKIGRIQNFGLNWKFSEPDVNERDSKTIQTDEDFLKFSQQRTCTRSLSNEILQEKIKSELYKFLMKWILWSTFVLKYLKELLLKYLQNANNRSYS